MRTLIDLLPPPLKISYYKQAEESLQDIKYFLESHSHFAEATTTSNLIERVAMLHSVCARETTIDDFFNQN